MARKARFALIGILIVTGLLLASCTGPAGPAGSTGPAGPAGSAGPAGAAGAAAVAEPERMPPAVMVVPDMGTSKFKAAYYGANFEPGEKITVRIPIARVEDSTPVETIIGPGGVGGPFEVDELGSFILTGIGSPVDPGVYAVRVYDEEGKMIASTLLVVTE